MTSAMAQKGSIWRLSQIGYTAALTGHVLNSTYA